jgi:hypothetical protein
MESEREIGMSVKNLIPAAVFLGLTAVSVVSLPSAYVQEKEERPAFHVKRVVFDNNVENAQNAAGKPDGRYAEIKPGGTLVLFMEAKIYPSGILDDGLIICREEGNYGLAGWFLTETTDAGPQYAWMPLAKGRSPSSFRITTLVPGEGSAGIDMIRIMNDDSKSIFVDAVAGYGR